MKKSTAGDWQKRYFETNGCFLTYYKSQKMSKLLAALSLPQVGDIRIGKFLFLHYSHPFGSRNKHSNIPSISLSIHLPCVQPVARTQMVARFSWT